eukprot:2349201-Amphidinium_carterae.1
MAMAWSTLWCASNCTVDCNSIFPPSAGKGSGSTILRFTPDWTNYTSAEDAPDVVGKCAG